MSQNPMMIVPGALQAMQALQGLRTSVKQQGVVPWRTIDLVQLRVSQINGCSACVEEHSCLLKEAGETANLFTRLGTVTQQGAGMPKREGERAHRT
jgi:AhpD family alkylhydroperoxidase